MQLAGIPYVSNTVNPSNSAASSLLALMRAVNPNCPATCRELDIQLDPENGSGTYLYVGDSTTTNANMGMKLGVGVSRTYHSGSGMSDIPLANIFLLGSASDLDVNVEVLQ